MCRFLLNKIRAEGEHRWCYGSSQEAANQLLNVLPQAVMAVTVSHDLLLPPAKHAAALRDMVRAASRRPLKPSEEAREATIGDNDDNFTLFSEPSLSFHG